MQEIYRPVIVILKESRLGVTTEESPYPNLGLEDEILRGVYPEPKDEILHGVYPVAGG